MIDKRTCFSKQVRLLTADEFSRVFKNPLRSSDRYFTILAIFREQVASNPTRHYSNARLGLAISKKNAKRAVDRNRIKRLIRESFRLSRHQLPAIDLVVMAKPVTKYAENRKVFESLDQHWKKLKQQLQTAKPSFKKSDA